MRCMTGLHLWGWIPGQCDTVQPSQCSLRSPGLPEELHIIACAACYNVAKCPVLQWHKWIDRYRHETLDGQPSQPESVSLRLWICRWESPTAMSSLPLTTQTHFKWKHVAFIVHVIRLISKCPANCEKNPEAFGHKLWPTGAKVIKFTRL